METVVEKGVGSGVWRAESGVRIAEILGVDNGQLGVESVFVMCSAQLVVCDAFIYTNYMSRVCIRDRGLLSGL